MGGKQKDGEDRKEQHRQDSAKDDRAATVVMHSSLRMPMK
ncbi:hypothetical protein J2S64_001447 [Paeniglutamicibacter sulfureus]|uniref:Uncharacterized protein n=1 Tax=Paeniglutamicibacter sulfureus TaxID=43666 RepID=A0ABU2BHK5_9MICC|nr:hypothetical protein [Paeniglutamicibacter sulfureus]